MLRPSPTPSVGCRPGHARGISLRAAEIVMPRRANHRALPCRSAIKPLRNAGVWIRSVPLAVTELAIPRCNRAVTHSSRCRLDSLLVLYATATWNFLLEHHHFRQPWLVISVRSETADGTRKEMNDPKTRRLLAVHNGSIPAEVSDLASLRLLLLIADPKSSRKTVA